MCGIAGVFGLRGMERNFSADLLAMAKRIKHRGPDGEGMVFFNKEFALPLFTDETPKASIGIELPYSPQKECYGFQEKNKGGFAHRRLSILDLSAHGHQPMCSANKRYWITYNGEIYNYKEVRKELELGGTKFFSNSDTEVLLYAFEKWGVTFLERISGMFSFAIYDTVEERIFAARDRFGVKPFYYRLNEETFVFASEQKAFLGLSDFRPELNQNAFVDFFYFDTLEQEEEGFFKNIFELRPGHFLILDLRQGFKKMERYYSLDESSGKIPNLSEQQIIERTKALVEKAVETHLQSDVQVGSCLSGGLDSSAIVAIASGALDYPIPLFTASFKGYDFDEGHWAKMVAQKSGGIQHFVNPDDTGLFSNLEELIYSQDIPLFSTSTFAQHSVMSRAASEGIKVVLDGQGGDELFGGYPNHYSAYWKELLKKGNWKILRDEIQHAPVGMKSAKQIIKQWMVDPVIKRMGDGGGRGMVEMLRPELKWLNRDFVQSASGIAPKNSHNDLNRLLRDEFTGVRLKGYLKCEDRASMWHSVESRTPFTDDHQLVEWVFSLPSSLKIKKGINKYLLRKAMEGRVPEEIINRKDKLGYVTPNQQWLMKNREQVKAMICDEGNPFYHVKLIEKEFDQFLEGRVSPNDHRLFKWLSFAVWRKQFNI